MKHELTGRMGAFLAVLAFTSAPASAQVTLNVSVFTPHAHPLVAHMTMPFCTDVEKATAGRVKCNLLPKAVVAPPQTFDAIKEGLADLSFIVHGYTPGRFALADIVERPFLADSAEAMSVAYQRVYERMLAKADEHKGVVVLAMFAQGPQALFNTKRAINTAADFKGMKIRVGTNMTGEILQALGAIPILKPATEVYELLSSGVADGVTWPKESPAAFKVPPLLKHMTVFPGGLSNASFAYIVNPAKWSQVSETDRNSILLLAGENLARRSGKAWDAADATGLKPLQEARVEIKSASPRLIAEVKQRTAGLEQAWIKSAGTKGVDGTAALTALRAEIAALEMKAPLSK